MALVLVPFVLYYAVMFALLIKASCPGSFTKYRVLLKTLTSIGFIAIAVYCGLVGPDFSFFIWMLPGFVLCLVGDIFMALTDSNGKKKHFMAGMAAFALGHVSFLFALFTRSPFNPLELIIPIGAFIIVLLLSYLPRMKLDNMKCLAACYSILVSWLFSRSLFCLVALGPNPATLLLTIGTGLFFMSDTLILFHYFYEQDWKPLVFAYMFTYYAGVALMAASLLFV